VGWRAIAGAIAYPLLLLQMRVYDELKDLETDQRMALAGDPRYLGRPIVTGRVRAADLVALRWVVTGALLAINAGLGMPWPLAMFVVVFVTMWASFHWFFWPPMRDRLLVSFATHNPIGLLVYGYFTAIYAREHRAGAIDLREAILLALGYWLTIAVWEIARKIRIPEDETAYATYSKILGYRAAGAVVIAGTLLSVTSLSIAGARAGLGPAYTPCVCATALPLVVRAAHFIAAPTSARANLRGFAEVYAGLVTLVSLLIVVARHGIAVTS